MNTYTQAADILMVCPFPQGNDRLGTSNGLFREPFARGMPLITVLSHYCVCSLYFQRSPWRLSFARLNLLQCVVSGFICLGHFFLHVLNWCFLTVSIFLMLKLLHQCALRLYSYNMHATIINSPTGYPHNSILVINSPTGYPHNSILVASTWYLWLLSKYSPITSDDAM